MSSRRTRCRPKSCASSSARRLPEYMIPGAFVRIDALPLTPNGKLDKRALPEPSDANALASAGFAAPETPAEAKLAEILEGVLGRGNVGVDDNFFLLGGHSLLGTQVVLRAGEAFGIDLTLRDLFQAPTIRQLAARIEEIVFAMIEAMSDDEAATRAAAITAERRAERHDRAFAHRRGPAVRPEPQPVPAARPGGACRSVPLLPPSARGSAGDVGSVHAHLGRHPVRGRAFRAEGIQRRPHARSRRRWRRSACPRSARSPT